MSKTVLLAPFTVVSFRENLESKLPQALNLQSTPSPEEKSESEKGLESSVGNHY